MILVYIFSKELIPSLASILFKLLIKKQKKQLKEIF